MWKIITTENMVIRYAHVSKRPNGNLYTRTLSSDCDARRLLSKICDESECAWLLEEVFCVAAVIIPGCPGLQVQLLCLLLCGFMCLCQNLGIMCHAELFVSAKSRSWRMQYIKRRCKQLLFYMFLVLFAKDTLTMA